MYLLLDYLEYLSINNKFGCSDDCKDIKLNLYTDSIDTFKNIIYENDLDIENLKDILSSYVMLREFEISESKYYKYRKYFPNIRHIDNIFTWACYEVDNNSITGSNNILLKDMNESKNVDTLTMLLIILYLLLLTNINKIVEWKLLIKHIKIKYIEESKCNIILYRYIVKYINSH